MQSPTGQATLQAEQALQRATEVYGEDTPAQIYYLLAITHINLKDYAEARAALVRLEADEEYASKGTQLERFIANRIAADRAG